MFQWDKKHSKMPKANDQKGKRLYMIPMRNNQENGPDRRFSVEMVVRQGDKQRDRRFKPYPPEVRRQMASEYLAPKPNAVEEPKKT